MKVIKTQVLIIGGGAAGLNAALNLETEEIILIEMPGSNSIISPWNMMVKPKERQREEMLIAASRTNDVNLIDEFLDRISETIIDLKRNGFKLRKSNIGLIPDYKLPGVESRSIFLKKIKSKGVKILKGKVGKFIIDKKGKVVGVDAGLIDGSHIKIFFNYLIIAAGGIGGSFEFSTGSPDSDGSILSLCYEAGFKTRDLEYFMFHPFLIIDKRFPRTLLSGDLLTKLKFEDENGLSFLSGEVEKALETNNHHYVFPKMTKEFYLQSLKGRIFGRLICSEVWFKKYKKENEFGFIFKNFLKNKIRKIEFHPAFHYLVGGIAINGKAETSQKNIYAAGEITGGLHGKNRIGGLAILEALIFGKIAAIQINEKIKEKNVALSNHGSVEGLGSLGLSKKIRVASWRALGPVREKQNLKKLNFLLVRKEKITSQEKILKRITEICLKKRSH